MHHVSLCICCHEHDVNGGYPMDQWVKCTYTLREACDSKMEEFYPSSKCGAKNCIRQ
jgi:hypothetical protein